MTRTIVFVLGGIVLCIVVLAALLSMAARANAQDGYGGAYEYHWDWTLGSGDPHRRWHRSRYHAPVHHYDWDEDHYHGRIHYYRDDGRRDEIVVEERERHHDERRCLDHPEEVVSTEHLGGDSGAANALTSAHKLWSARVAWYYGAMWMDPKNAVQALFHCGQSSAMDTISGRLVDNAEKILGATDTANQRCVFSAIPCVVPLEPEDDHHDQR